MARSDLVKRMIESHQRGDDSGFAQAAEEVIAEERRKRHDSLADDLERLIQVRPGRRPATVSSLKALPSTRDDVPLLHLVQPTTAFTDLVLREDTLGTLRSVVDEHQQSELLAAHSLSPRNRLLFVGPPGCGKSQSAEALATQMGRPIARVHLASVVSSYLGETAKHLDQILTFCETGQWVLVFDEIDTLAKDRGERGEHGELRRVVATFLQLLDGYQGEALIVATSNHAGLLDDAMWRRFDEVVAFEPPNQAEIAELLQIKLRRFRTKFARTEVARDLKGCSHAEVEMVCRDAARSVVLDGRAVVEATDVSDAVRRMRQRRREVERFLM
jgi:SpoVK/Ycf46/Vps4 family AAA+-type ATPase